MRESDLWRKLKSKSPHWTMNRIESSITPGFPDVVAYTLEGRVQFIELKAWKTKEPPADGKLRDAQKSWHAKALAHNLTVSIVGVDAQERVWVGRYNGNQPIDWAELVVTSQTTED